MSPDTQTLSDLSTLADVLEAKAARDVVRQALVNACLARADNAEIDALLEADRQATARLGALLSLPNAT